VERLFPHPCGAEFAKAVSQGADPLTVVPDAFVVVHGGTGLAPPTGTNFSGAVGPTLEAAAAAVPFGQIRVTTAEAIRKQSGMIEWSAEKSRLNTVNNQHVNIVERGVSTFSDLQRSPVPRRQRIDGDLV
jgi:hypothetical protein